MEICGEKVKRLLIVVIAALIIVAIIASFMILMSPMGGREEVLKPDDLIENVKTRMTITSPAFKNGGSIPLKYTRYGENLSPPLEWNKIENAESYVLIVYDIDAPLGVFYHWILYNIPPEVTRLPEGIPQTPVTDYGLQGVNNFNKIGYDGPYPPENSKHRYVFLILALDKKLDLDPGAKPHDVLKACKGHVIAYGKLIGIYGR